MTLKIAGATRASADGGVNQDHFVVVRNAPFPIAAVFDGVGKAVGVAKRAATILENLMRDATLADAAQDHWWRFLVRRMDMMLGIGGPETTMVAAAVIGQEAIIVSAGDSRVYLVPLEGTSRIVTETSKSRLGSGEAQAFVARVNLSSRDVLVLASDGLNGLGPGGVDRIVRAATMKDVADVPTLLLDGAGKRGGLADDATTIVIRG